MVRVGEEIGKVCARNRQGLRKMVVIRRACASVVAQGCEFATALYGMRAEIDDGSVACWAWGWAVVWGRDAKNRLFWSLAVKTDGFSRSRKRETDVFAGCARMGFPIAQIIERFGLEAAKNCRF